MRVPPFHAANSMHRLAALPRSSALLLASLCAWSPRGGARPKTLQEKLDSTQGKLSQVAREPERAGDDDRRTERGDRLDDRRSLGAAPAAGRGRGANWRRSRTSSTARPPSCAADKRQLAVVRARLQRALGGAARTARRDLRGRQPRHAQRRPRIGELVGGQRARPNT